MELTPVTYLIVLPLVFLAGFVDSVAGGGGTPFIENNNESIYCY